MPEITLLHAALAAIVLGGLITQTMTGFGFNVVAVTLGSLMVPLDAWLPVVITLNIPMSAWIAVQERAHINWPLVLRRILPLMIAGGVLGLAALFLVSGDWLKRGFGLLVVAIALRELYKLLIAGQPAMPVSTKGAPPWMFAAGIAQGMYGSGGPFLVHALTRLNLGKATFRASMIVVWLTLNCLLVVAYVAKGWWTASVGVQTAWLLPLVPVGIVIGNWLHNHAPARQFAIVVQCVLLAAGLALAFK
ncbi:sulfite exporter TauE/SafE family protein [bacterium]|nr:sulfite exporter TauE/SafE family protein [bacterium]